MSQGNFKESVSAFISYVKLFLFLGLIGAIGYYFYDRNLTGKKAAQAAEDAALVAAKAKALAGPEPETVSGVSGKPLKPSVALRPVMQANLSRLASEITDGVKLEVDPAFLAVEKQIEAKKVETGRQQAAWNAASAVCKEIRRVASERGTISDSLRRNAQPIQPASVVPISKAETEEKVRKAEFFVKAANQRWQIAIARHQKKVESLFEQLLSTENLSATIWDQPKP